MPRTRDRNGRTHDPRGRFTAERTTTTTTTTAVTERVTLEQADTLVPLPDTGPGEIRWAQGWDPSPLQTRHDYLAQRQEQRDQALGLLVLYAESTPPGPAPEWVVRQAVNVLRAGPGATLMECTLGRSC